MHDTNIPMSHGPMVLLRQWWCWPYSPVWQQIHLMLFLMIPAASLQSCGDDAAAMAATVCHSLVTNVSWWCLCSRVHMLVVKGPTLAGLPERNGYRSWQDVTAPCEQLQSGARFLVCASIMCSLSHCDKIMSEEQTTSFFGSLFYYLSLIYISNITDWTFLYHFLVFALIKSHHWQIPLYASHTLIHVSLYIV